MDRKFWIRFGLGFAVCGLAILACTIDIPGVSINLPVNEGGDGRTAGADEQHSVDTPVPTLAPLNLATEGKVYYIHPDGGDRTQCNGLAPYPYSGSGEHQDCAWDHPFRALPPGGTPFIAGGDVLIILQGSYMMGLGAPGADNESVCDPDFPWDCVMLPIPSGPDPEHPTRILGYGWDTGCANPPELWGTERARMILDLRGVENAVVACLELTDHSDCVRGHSGGLACNTEKYPYGEWASDGIHAEDSAEVYLLDLNIHGFAEAGVRAGRIKNWALENVRIAANGWVGWEGDIDGDDSNSGILLFRNWTVEWNGCGETYPAEEPVGCWGQTAGGYGDGVGTGATQGRWIIEDSKFLHNTSDGLDLLYARPGSLIEIYRTIAMGNAGDQIKISGPAILENVVAVSNCGFFDLAKFTHHVDSCRAGGSAFSFTLWQGDQISVWNSTIAGQGDCLTIAECAEDGGCNGSELVLMRNNIFLGGNEYHSSDTTCLFWFGEDGLPANPYDIDYSLILDTKNTPPCPGPHDLCDVTPGLVNPSLSDFKYYLLASSKAIDAGTSEGAPKVDIEGAPRDDKPDIGAFEFQKP